ncbi:MAG: lysophospholipid acyltransferase family protein [Dysgonamonadaceae bacterium]|jgi:1-acyl-sn-glycerol-3-phosphate acyltransferase|nr:lysophospholipid acyltransferase family protein [Dysgonamonadaceae bacterium]
MRKISNFILKLFGWRIVNVLPDVPKCVIAVAPHTSNLDLFMGKLVYWALGRKAKFLIKKEWFVFPLNLIFRALGGIPVARNKNTSMTDALAEEFHRHDKLQIAVTPEGTRKHVPEWKKGFYFIAMKAQVPILLAGLDYTKKEIVFFDLFQPTGNLDEDMAVIQAYYKDMEGKHPQNFSN